MASTPETTKNHFGRCSSPAGGSSETSSPGNTTRNQDNVHTLPLNGLNDFISNFSKDLKSKEKAKKTLEKFQKRASKLRISKFIQGGMLKHNPGDTLTKRLNRALKCCDIKYKNPIDETIQTRYCGTRFCQVCNGIRTAILFKRLIGEMKKSPKWFMVVLSAQNCPGEELREDIHHKKECWKKIDKLFKNNKVKKGNGFYTYEVTYNSKENTFHPHIHILVDNEITANMILEHWLKLNAPGKAKRYALRDKGNKVIEMRPGNQEHEEMLLELIKYATKPGKKDPNTNDIYINAKALVTIYQALEGFQIFQTFGTFRGIKDLTEEEVSKELESQDENIDCPPGLYKYNMTKGDWIHQESGQTLTGNKDRRKVYDNGVYISSTAIQSVIDKIPKPN